MIVLAKSSTPPRRTPAKPKTAGGSKAETTEVVAPVAGPTAEERAAAEVTSVDPQLKTDGEDAVSSPDDAQPTPDPELEKQKAVVATDPQLAGTSVAEEATDDAPEPVEPEPEPQTKPEPRPDPQPEARPAAAAAPARGGFFPALLGGLCAGLIGYGIAYMQFADRDDGTAALADRIAEIEGVLATPQEGPDLTPLQDGMTGLDTAQRDLGDRLAALGDAMAGIDTRLAEIEKQPTSDGTLAETAIAAYEREIAALREEMNARQTDLQAMTESALAELQATRAEAQEIEETAVQSARNATARASLARVQAALETGAPLGAAVGDLEDALGQSAPGPLIDIAEDGAPTLGALQADFPAAARAALRAARDSGDGPGGFAGFLRNQFDVRSTTPQEGDGADAVLSRAEAALKDGRLNDTLAELSALSEPARAAMSDWLAEAEARAAAIDAADRLATTLNDN